MIDVTMAAVRRPDLVRRTLASFQENLFQRLPVQRLFVNIDPVWGSPPEGEHVREICSSMFPGAVVRMPTQASYGGAVKWLWNQPETKWLLHLEDDWLLSNKISLFRLRWQMQDIDVAQIKIANWKRLKRRHRPPELGLCPLFCRTSFAKIVSAKIDVSLDPDKQFRDGTNPELMAAVKDFRAVYFGGPLTCETAIDIGRDWRDMHGIEKKKLDGVLV